MRSESDGLKSRPRTAPACTPGFIPNGNRRRRPIACFPGIRKSALSSSPPVANPQVKQMIGVSDPHRSDPGRGRRRHHRSAEGTVWPSGVSLLLGLMALYSRVGVPWAPVRRVLTCPCSLSGGDEDDVGSGLGRMDGLDGQRFHLGDPLGKPRGSLDLRRTSPLGSLLCTRRPPGCSRGRDIMTERFA